MNIFIAGGAGFIGSHLCDALIKKGNKIIVADKLIMGKQNIEHSIFNIIICSFSHYLKYKGSLSRYL